MEFGAFILDITNKLQQAKSCFDCGSFVIFLSPVLHPLLFNDESMHQRGNAPGPLNWFIENPRTIRPSALHLTGLWLLNPIIIKFYLKDFKLLSLYGSVAFDEDS